MICESHRESADLRAGISAAIQNVEILAIAGCSAGSIIASLVWAGWSPRSLRDKLCEQARLKILHALPGDFEPAESPFDFRAWGSLSRDISAISSSALRGEGRRRGIGRVLRKLSFYYDAWKILGELGPHYANRGVFRGNHLERVVEELLREGLVMKGCNSPLPTSPLTFADIGKLSEAHPEVYFPPLVLAVTNLGTQNVELINSIDEKYKDIPISAAVRASAGYPVFFRPVELPHLSEPSWFIDGGVISNFPAWAFSEEFRKKMHDNESYRGLAYRPWVHVGLRLVDEDIRSDATGEILPLFDHKQLERPSFFTKALTRLLLGQARNRLEDLISSSLARSVIVAQPYEQSGGPDNLLDFDAINERRGLHPVPKTPSLV